MGSVVQLFDQIYTLLENIGKEIENNEEEAKTVRLIFNQYASGKVYKAITNQLNKLGYKTKRGNNFAVGSIKDIM